MILSVARERPLFDSEHGHLVWKQCAVLGLNRKTRSAVTELRHWKYRFSVTWARDARFRRNDP